MNARRLRIAGRVQGVGYRQSIAREAERLGIAGWVRNRSDGTVEATVQGTAAAVDELVRWAGRGPPGARVARVEVAETDAEAVSGFEIRATA